MLRRFLIVLTVLALLCGGAGAEVTGRESSTINAGMEIAMVDGTVYCMSVQQGLWDKTTIYRWTGSGLEAVWSDGVDGVSLYALDGALLLTVIRRNILEELSGAGTYEALRIDPRTWETEELAAVHSTRGRLVCDGENLLCFSWSGFDGDTPWCRLATWQNGEWTVEFSWRSDYTDEDRRGSFLYPDFVILEMSEHTPETSDIRLRTLADGREYLLQGTDAKWYGTLSAVLEDGRLYYLENKRLYVHDLEAGTTELLLTLTGYDYYEFILDEKRMVIMGSDGLVEIYDRATLTQLHAVQLPQGAFDWLLSGDTLYVFQPRGTVHSVGGKEVERWPAYMATVNIATGESLVVELN